MQEQNETFRNFLKRTDVLAQKKGCNVEGLIEILGISRASLFSYRTGKRPISSKAWRKLEAAEREAGIKIRSESNPLLRDIPVEDQPSDDYLRAICREDDARNPTTYHTAMMRKLAKLARLEHPCDEEASDQALDGHRADYMLAMDEAIYRSTLQTLQAHGTLNKLTGLDEVDESEWPKA